MTEVSLEGLTFVKSDLVEESIDDLIFLRSKDDGNSSSLGKITKDSDLLKGVYEGGFKVWECSLDLVRFLQKTTESLAGLTVFDVGCGHGIPGILCLQKGAKVIFQDLNVDVLERCTSVNILSNAPGFASSAKLIAGNWDEVPASIEPNSVDVILSSETIYCVDYIKSLLSLFRHSLKIGGFALVAAKRFYFGVGGGTLDFMDDVEDFGGFECETALVLEDGSSNTREILKVTRIS
eukprot:TRINITY_DN11258_c0_g1_i1.p1 TRINITY_DN11258_c0_g1~~TRINITY_DN11258_c0_g1_i1.p1  ORF type:complete len:236 (+),score=55.85 TRINITY_DN11258_c0_g1_i1:121-828(+)